MTHNRVSIIINNIAVWIVRLAGAGIFLFLSWYALRYTQYMDPATGEFPINIQDSTGKNLGFVLCIMLLYGAFIWGERLLRQKQRILRWISGSMLAAAVLWMYLAGHWWISGNVRPPEGDQLYAYVSACAFANGNYDALLPGGYCGIYPQQLGFTAILELFFKITGSTEFYMWQKWNVFCVMGIVIFGYLLVRDLTGKWADKMLYCLLTAACLPMIFYTSWVYGEILSILCSVAAGWMMLRYGKSRKKGWLAGVLVLSVPGILVRKNFLILLLALALAAVVWSIVQKDRVAFLFAVLVLVLPLLSCQGIYKMYEVRSGYEHSEGFPVTSWISMGLQENQGRYGWYYDYPGTIYEEAGQDTETAARIAEADIRERLHTFSGSAGYTWTFFREKLLSQWNAPLYQSLFFTTNFREEYRPEPESMAGKIAVGGAWFQRIFEICDRLQFLLYLGMLCYFCFAVKKDGNMIKHVLAVAVIGGFLFSILWEAKARYIFPYYVVMYPLAVEGYCQAVRSIGSRLEQRKAAKKKKQNAQLEKVS